MRVRVRVRVRGRVAAPHLVRAVGVREEVGSVLERPQGGALLPLGLDVLLRRRVARGDDALLVDGADEPVDLTEDILGVGVPVRRRRRRTWWRWRRVGVEEEEEEKKVATEEKEEEAREEEERL